MIRKTGYLGLGVVLGAAAAATAPQALLLISPAAYAAAADTYCHLLEEIHRLLRGGAARGSFELMVETGVLAVLSPYLAGLLEGAGAPTTAPPVGDITPRSTVPRVEYDEDDPAERDPDDPEEEPGSLPSNGEAELGAANGAEELDPEEREWHRVCADEPSPRPAQLRRRRRRGFRARDGRSLSQACSTASAGELSRGDWGGVRQARPFCFEVVEDHAPSGPLGHLPRFAGEDARAPA